MTSVGEILRSQRKSQGRTVADISENLCITAAYVSAIERDALKDLPGVFFYKSYVRQYAAMVGLEYTQVQAGVEALAAIEEPPVLPQKESRLAATFQAVAGYCAWLRTLLLHPGKIGAWASGRQL